LARLFQLLELATLLLQTRLTVGDFLAQPVGLLQHHLDGRLLLPGLAHARCAPGRLGLLSRHAISSSVVGLTIPGGVTICAWCQVSRRLMAARFSGSSTCV